jgi:hypothetical protein
MIAKPSPAAFAGFLLRSPSGCGTLPRCIHDIVEGVNFEFYRSRNRLHPKRRKAHNRHLDDHACGVACAAAERFGLMNFEGLPSWARPTAQLIWIISAVHVAIHVAIGLARGARWSARGLSELPGKRRQRQYESAIVERLLRAREWLTVVGNDDSRSLSRCRAVAASPPSRTRAGTSRN